jgi:hypothetical protein
MSSQDQVLNNISIIEIDNSTTDSNSNTETNKRNLTVSSNSINLTVSLKPTIFNNLKLNECPNAIKIKN